MPSFYPESIQYPKTVKAILESLIIYTAQILYADLFLKDPISALKRVVISDLDAGNEFLLRSQTDYFESMNFEYPVTFYQVDSREYKTNYNQIASRGVVYSFELKRKVSAFPNSLTIKMVTLYNHPDDYMRALSILQMGNASLTRLYSATKFIDYENNINKILPIPYDLTWEVEKGNYTFKFQEYLKINKLYDVVHTAKINFWDFVISEYLESLEINKLILNMGEINDSMQNAKGLDSDNYLNLNSNKLSLSDPVFSSVIEGSMISYLTSKVSFHFINSPDQIILENSFAIFPYVKVSFEWDVEGQNLDVTFIDQLDINIEYQITFNIVYKTNSLLHYLSFRTRG